jgi:hypothetical protein
LSSSVAPIIDSRNTSASEYSEQSTYKRLLTHLERLLHTNDGRRESEDLNSALDLGLSMRKITVPSFLHAISHCSAVHGVVEGTMSEYDARHDDCPSAGALEMARQTPECARTRGFRGPY